MFQQDSLLHTIYFAENHQSKGQVVEPVKKSEPVKNLSVDGIVRGVPLE